MGKRQKNGSNLADNEDSDFECFDQKLYIGKKNFLSIFRKAILHSSIKNCIRLTVAHQKDNLDERKALAEARANLKKIGNHKNL